MKKKLFFIMIIALCLTTNNLLPVSAASGKVVVNKVYISEHTYTLKISGATEKVKWNISDNKKVKKVKSGGKYGQKLTIKTKKMGNCKITATSGTDKYVYNVHIEKKPQLKEYNLDKTKIQITKVKKKKRYFILRFKVSNGRRTSLDFEIENKLQKKSNGKWEDIEAIADSAGVGQGISPKTSYSFSVDLTGLYNPEKIQKGKYRILVDLGGKEKYIQFKIE